MGKRNVRISHIQLPERYAELSGKEVHVVMRDGRTFFGHVDEATPAGLRMRDQNAHWTSRKRHTHQLALHEVAEVIYDLVTEY